jgi:Predicted methyltransferase|uniref:Class I SAM-dependent methyltransferase family protein n=1 Tax=Ignisphaera aggregans TaxID=334771 RepID=A0A7J2TAN9_9CREN
MREGPLLRKIAKRILGSEYSSLIWKRIEILGDVAIIRKPFDLPVDVFKAIGEELLRSLPYIKSVWLSTSPVHGFERIREYVHLAGEVKTEVLYKEYGCVFKVDFTKVYVSPVLGFDRMRIAKMVKRGERILNMFAGFAPYSIIISKHAQPSYIVSIDLNKHAVKYARINVELNKVSAVNEILHGDAMLLVDSFSEKFDRILMPYPELFEKALRVSIKAVKLGGYLHPHLFVNAENKKVALQKAFRNVTSVAKEFGSIVEPVGGHVIRGVASRKYHVVVDVIVKQN